MNAYTGSSGRGARSMAVYAIVAYDLAGRKDVLGLWMRETEGAHHWMGVFDELRQRGVEVECQHLFGQILKR